jgi:hypothetical protein
MCGGGRKESCEALKEYTMAVRSINHESCYDVKSCTERLLVFRYRTYWCKLYGSH